ncbi:MAG: HD domain-containing protein [candidate division WOR-3 bacterium]|nr:HD domain-containing protein [candidate division WOR-3 bacterium]MCX7757270.1 HD domain-containing protein [candidate division WOR-3 bacterium]MDW7988251.1 HD domain-containing protein [candidate division WOR-3 bacterium]
MKHQFVKDLNAGVKVNDIFYIISRRHCEKRDGDTFLILELSDKTGIINAKIWDNPESLGVIATPGNFVRVEGIVSEYNGKNQIVVSNLHFVGINEISAQDFIPHTESNIEELYDEFKHFIKNVEDHDYKQLLDNIFSKEEIVKKFKLAPASTQVHHGYLGGLLEHTVTMLRVAQAMLNFYPELNHALVITGVALHDIGKLWEYQYDTGIMHTDEGILLGHIVIGYEFVKNEIVQINGFSKEKTELLLHIILSHHGQKEFGSPVTPKFAEAFMVHIIDNLDARLNMFKLTVDKNRDQRWSEFNQFLGTKVFIKKRE